MRLAYCISAYTDPCQLKRLVDALGRDGYFFIHVDKNVDVNAFKEIVHGENVHYVNSIYIRWATISQVEYQMNMMQAALDFSLDFDYIFMLSAFDYPVWSNTEISKYLKENKGTEFLQAMAVQSTYYLRDLQREIRPDIEIGCLGKAVNRYLRGVLRLTLRLSGIKKARNFKIRKKIYEVYKGSDYYCITSALAKYVINTYRKNPEIKRYFRHTFAPSETVIHTIAFNSPFKDRCLTCEGEYEGLCNMTPLHYIEGCHIKILGLEDYDKVRSSGKMFARKFRSGISEELMEKLDKERK